MRYIRFSITKIVRNTTIETPCYWKRVDRKDELSHWSLVRERPWEKVVPIGDQIIDVGGRLFE